jgi:putative PIN family toxin of toxin-antitoxin system
LPRAVLDTIVFLRALINPQPRCGRLLGELADRYELALSPPIIAEVLEVLHRPSLRAKLPQIGDTDAAMTIGLMELALIVEPTEAARASRDPDDDVVLACALAAHATDLVTEDKDLLTLADLHGVKIVQPSTFLALLEAEA